MTIEEIKNDIGYSTYNSLLESCPEDLNENDTSWEELNKCADGMYWLLSRMISDIKENVNKPQCQWHKYPDEKPENKTETTIKCIVAVEVIHKGEVCDRYVGFDVFYAKEGRFVHRTPDERVVAWQYMPEFPKFD